MRLNLDTAIKPIVTHLGLNYALTKNDSVGVRFARSYGDEEKEQWRATYTRNF